MQSHSDQYSTIELPSLGEYKEKGSKFLAFAYPLNAPDDWKAPLENLKKEHFKSRHHCFAWRWGLEAHAVWPPIPITGLN